MRIYLSSKEAKAIEGFRKANPHLKNIICRGDNSFSSFINDLIKSEEDSCLIMSADSFTDKGFISRVRTGIAKLEEKYQQWGLAGNGGYGGNLYGLSASPVVKYFSDLEGGPNLPARILPAQYLASGTLLLNAPILRKNHVFLPDLECANLLGLALSLAAQKAGLACFILPELLVFHDSDQQQIAETSAGKNFISWLSSIVSPKRLPLTQGFLALPDAKGTMDPEYSSLECSRPVCQKKVCIVVRSRFQNKERLWRTLNTIKAFIAASGYAEMYQPLVVSDLQNENTELEGIPFKHFAPGDPLEDSRFFLIRQASLDLECDYLWFIDDDDWLFPNMANFISLSIQASPIKSVFYVGGRHFKEKELADGKVWPGASYAQADYYYDPKNFSKSIFGKNHSPFCGVIFPAEYLKQIFTANDFANIIYFEDYTLEQMIMYRQDYFPIVIDVMAAGISVREKGNTITRQDSGIWNRSECAMFAQIVQNANMLISVPDSRPAQNGDYFNREEMLYEIKFQELKFLMRRKLINKFKYIKGKLINKIFGK